MVVTLLPIIRDGVGSVDVGWLSFNSVVIGDVVEEVVEDRFGTKWCAYNLIIHFQEMFHLGVTKARGHDAVSVLLGNP